MFEAAFNAYFLCFEFYWSCLTPFAIVVLCGEFERTKCIIKSLWILIVFYFFESVQETFEQRDKILSLYQRMGRNFDFAETTKFS